MRRALAPAAVTAVVVITARTTRYVHGTEGAVGGGSKIPVRSLTSIHCERRAALLVGSGLALLAALEGVLTLLVFPSVGVYPFLYWHLLAVAGLALGGVAVAFRDRATRPIALLLGGWGLASVDSYLVVNPVGEYGRRAREQRWVGAPPHRADSR